MSGMNGCWHLAVNVCLAVMDPVEDVCPPFKGDALQRAILNNNIKNSNAHILTGNVQRMQIFKVIVQRREARNFFYKDQHVSHPVRVL
jgi:hypothetical protein